MDSQETTSNAVDSASDRGGDVVKSISPIAPALRPRPQGPHGLQPVNNGPIGQPRPGRHQIRFDGRFPLGSVNPGQFAQLRSHGPPRPPGNTFPQKQPQHSQNPPIVLNPRFPPSAVHRVGLQQGLVRPPHPANFPSQEFQRNALEFQRNSQQFQQPGFEQQNAPQQARSLEFLARQQEIAHKRLQRNESLLAIPQANSIVKEERKSIVSHIVDKMADIENVQKPRQFENSVAKEKEKHADDDDDDVVMDNKKSAGINSEISNGKDGIQTVKKMETATTNGKIDVKPEETKLNDSSANVRHSVLLDKMEENPKHSNSMEIDDKQCTVKRDDSSHTENSDGQKSGKVADKLNDTKENRDEHKSAAKNMDSVKEEVTKATKENSSLKSNSQDLSCSTNQSPNKQNLETPTNEEKTLKASTLETVQKGQNEEASSPNRSNTNTTKDVIQNQCEKGEKTATKSEDKIDENAEVNQSKDEQGLRTPNKNLGDSSIKTDEDKSNKNLEPSEKSEDKSRTTSASGKDEGAEEKKVLDESSMKPSESSSTKVEQSQNESKTSDSPSKLPTNISIEIKENKIQQESKALSKPIEPEAPASPPKPDTNAQTETKINESIEEIKSAEKDLDKSQKNITVEVKKTSNETQKSSSDQIQTELSCSLNEEELKNTSDDSANEERPNSSSTVDQASTKESTVVSENSVDTAKVSKENHVESSQHDIENLLVTNVDSSAAKSPIPSEETGKLSKSPVQMESQEKLPVPELLQSPPKSPDERVKGFDNGQRRSLSIKSSASCSPRSPLSPKSPVNNENMSDDKKEDAEMEKKSAESKSSSKPSTPKVQQLQTPGKLDEKSRKKSLLSPELENGNATNESAQSCTIPTTNGVEDSPLKKSPSKSKDSDKRSTAGSPVKSPSKSVKSLPRTPETPSSTSGQEKKKVPMNKVQVGSAPSPNLKTVRSKIGSLDNASYKPGGGKVKIENRKLDFSKAQPKIAAKNEKYTPSGGDKKIAQVKLQWNAKPKVGSLDNATYKPGGGDKKIETVKLDFKDKAKPKVGSKDNAKHIPGGGSVKSSATPPKTPQDSADDIQTQKIDIKAESKIGSMDNVKHKPGGGDKKIFNDKDYLRQTGSNVESLSGSGSQVKDLEEIHTSTEQTKNNLPQPPPTTPTKTQSILSPSSAVTPKAIRSSLARSPESIGSKKSSSSENTEANDRTNLSLEDSKNISKDKKLTSPTSSRSSNNLYVKNSDKSARTSKKASPKGLRLPKLAPSPTSQEPILTPETQSKITLPKLIESPIGSTRNTH